MLGLLVASLILYAAGAAAAIVWPDRDNCRRITNGLALTGTIALMIFGIAGVSGKPFALKWYFPHTASPGQLERLRMLVNKGSPSEKFLWPMELCSQSGLPGYGYLMRLRERQYKGILDLMKRRVEPTFRALASAGLQLADCYWQLHGHRYSKWLRQRCLVCNDRDGRRYDTANRFVSGKYDEVYGPESVFSSRHLHNSDRQ